jgi:superfamily I DNA/RNA helicase
VVAMHRAHHLARLGAGRVLVTTFTSTLATSLQMGLDLLVDDPDVRERIVVQHVDQLAHQIFRQRLGQPILLSQADEGRRWRHIRQALKLPVTDTFLAEEWRQVVLAQQIRDAEAYLAANRTGRGRPLGSRQRARVWAAIDAFQSGLLEAGVWTYETIQDEAAALLSGMEDKPFRHVIVDEAQDLSPSQWRLVRAAVAPAHDDVFIAGDTRQRIYQHRISLKAVGMNVAGRSARLTVNYRTTAEILAWSLKMFGSQATDDMDGGSETIAGYRCETHGIPPRLKSFRSRTDEQRGLVEQVRTWLDAGLEPSEIGVAARSNGATDALILELRRSGIDAYPLVDTQSGPGGVAVGTMHRMKGLEFRCMAVVGVTADTVPLSSAVTPIEADHATHQQDLQRERCLLFVACTRAREELYISWNGAPSEFIEQAG